MCLYSLTVWQCVCVCDGGIDEWCFISKDWECVTRDVVRCRSRTQITSRLTFHGSALHWSFLTSRLQVATFLGSRKRNKTWSDELKIAKRDLKQCFPFCCIQFWEWEWELVRGRCHSQISNSPHPHDFMSLLLKTDAVFTCSSFMTCSWAHVAFIPNHLLPSNLFTRRVFLSSLSLPVFEVKPSIFCLCAALDWVYAKKNQQIITFSFFYACFTLFGG